MNLIKRKQNIPVQILRRIVWAYVVVEKPTHPWYPAHILITSKGERVPVGYFLTENEKFSLVENLRTIIDSLKAN